MATEVSRLYLAKSEYRMSKQIRMTEIHKIQMFASCLNIRALALFRHSDFGFATLIERRYNK